MCLVGARMPRKADCQRISTKLSIYIADFGTKNGSSDKRTGPCTTSVYCEEESINKSRPGQTVLVNCSPQNLAPEAWQTDGLTDGPTDKGKTICPADLSRAGHKKHFRMNKRTSLKPKCIQTTLWSDHINVNIHRLFKYQWNKRQTWAITFRN